MAEDTELIWSTTWNRGAVGLRAYRRAGAEWPLELVVIDLLKRNEMIRLPVTGDVARQLALALDCAADFAEL